LGTTPCRYFPNFSGTAGAARRFRTACISCPQAYNVVAGTQEKQSAYRAELFLKRDRTRLGRQTVGVEVPGSLASYPFSVAKVTFASCINQYADAAREVSENFAIILLDEYLYYGLAAESRFNDPWEQMR